MCRIFFQTPEWLNSVKDVADSEELPLNVCRETLQQDKILRVIKMDLVKKFLEILDEIAELDDDVKKSCEQLGKCFNDSTVGAKIAELLRLNVQKTAEVPQARFIEQVVDVPVDVPRQVPAVQVVQKTANVPQTHFIDRAEDISVMQQRQAPTVQTIREAVEISQAQFRDKVDGMPVLVQHKVPMVQRVQKTVEVPNPSTVLGILRKKSTEALHVVDFAHEFAGKQDPKAKDGVNLGDENEKKRSQELEAEIVNR